MKPNLALRDLFWFVLVVGLALGWWVDRSNVRREWAKMKRERDQAEQERLVMDLIGRDSIPWMVAGSSLSGNAGAEFGKAFSAFQTASPDLQERMRKSAMARMAGAESEPQ